MARLPTFRRQRQLTTLIIETILILLLIQTILLLFPMLNDYNKVMGTHFRHPNPFQEDTTIGNELENANFSCDGLFRKQQQDVEMAKQWKYKSNFHNEIELLQLMDDCSSFKRRFLFPDHPLSREELDFPLAYGLIVYKNAEQVIRMIRALYWPQNAYCLSYDTKSNNVFQSIMRKLPKCFPNIFIPSQLYEIEWGGYGILQAVMSCLTELTSENYSNWRYFQYLSGTDLSLKTNFEMVQILKALNGSFNTNLLPIIEERFLNKTQIEPIPGGLEPFKASLSATFSRESAQVIIENPISQAYFKWLEGTMVPDESFWATVAGNPEVISMPGGFPAQKWLDGMEVAERSNYHDYIARYQVWQNQRKRKCFGKWMHESCVFGVADLPTLLKRKELIAHKIYLDYQPATFFCLIEAIRNRTVSSSY